jgi:hypothetical protein
VNWLCAARIAKLQKFGDPVTTFTVSCGGVCGAKLFFLRILLDAVLARCGLLTGASKANTGAVKRQTIVKYQTHCCCPLQRTDGAKKNPGSNEPDSCQLCYLTPSWHFIVSDLAEPKRCIVDMLPALVREADLLLEFRYKH